MSVCEEILVPPMSARAFAVKAGRTVRIVDVEGRQPGDLVAFKADDLSVKFSQARTRVENGCVCVAQGHALWTNTFPPQIMLTLTPETDGTHNLLYSPCCRYALGKRFGVSRDGCLEHLAQALKKWDVAPEAIPDPLSLFFRVSVDAAGRMAICDPDSKPGDRISLKAEMDCIVAVSTCSVPRPGKANSGYRVVILKP